MEFIKIAYCITIPIILLYTWLAGKTLYREWAINLLAVTNLLLIGNTVFLIRQLLGFYQLRKALHISQTISPQLSVINTTHLLLVCIMPFFALISNFRKSRWFSLLVFLIFLSFYPVSSWNLYDFGAKIIQYLCLLCVGYSMLWLLNRLPYQSSPS